MTKSHHKVGITRRGFLERTAGSLATAGILAGGLGATEAGPDPGKKLDSPTPDSTPKYGKIALEEHFALRGTIPASYTSLPTPESRLQIQDLGSGRIAEMDRSVWSSAFSRSPDPPASRPFSRRRKRSTGRGDRTIIWPNKSQRIPNV